MALLVQVPGPHDFPVSADLRANKRTNHQAGEPDNAPLRPKNALPVNASKERTPLLSPGELLKGRWRIEEQLGAGGFGQIYTASDVHLDQQAIVKAESLQTPFKFLSIEVEVLRKLQGKGHIAQFYACGRMDDCNYVVMSRLDRNLSELRKVTKHDRFTEGTWARLGLQMLRGIKVVHEAHYLHRDVKPANFVVGLVTQNTHRTVYVIDFGLCREYMNREGKLRMPRDKCGFRGTVRYVSVTTHQQKDVSRCDDLWSLFYILVEMAKGQLPWRKLSNDKEKVLEMKMQADHSPHKLADGLPSSFHDFIRHLQSLDYFSEPDYNYMSACLEEIMMANKVSLQDPYDWEDPELSYVAGPGQQFSATVNARARIALMNYQRCARSFREPGLPPFSPYVPNGKFT